MCWRPRTAALEAAGLKADFHCAPVRRRGKHSSIRRNCERQKVRRAMEETERGRERNERPLNLGRSENVIPISIEAPLWSYERARSQTVLLSSLSLVLRLNYLWKTSIEGMWRVKGFLVTKLKGKGALKWTKKCHINLRSYQRMWTLAQRPS